MNMIVGAAVDPALGQYIRRELDRRGWKDRVLAAKIDKAPSWVSDLINGKLKHPPDAGTLELIEEAIGIPQQVVLQAFGYLAQDDPAPVLMMTEGDIDWSRLPPELRRMVKGMVDAYFAEDAEEYEP